MRPLPAIADDFAPTPLALDAINQAYAVLRELSEDEATRLRYEARLKAQRNEWSRVVGAEHAERSRIVCNMARENMAKALIAKLVGITEPEV